MLHLQLARPYWVKEYLPEHMPREEDGTIPVIDGVRMTDDSARLFIFWNDDEC